MRAFPEKRTVIEQGWSLRRDIGYCFGIYAKAAANRLFLALDSSLAQPNCSPGGVRIRLHVSCWKPLN